MGLLLSTLVFCVGVIELITFYKNVRRHVQYPPVRGSLSHIRKGYIEELRNTRNKLIEDIEKLKEVPEKEHSPDSKNVIRDHYVLRSIPTFRLNSHEDIEIEYTEALARSRSPSPRRFLVTEKEHHDEQSTSRRRFVVSEEPQAIRKTKSQSSLPEFLIKEEKNSPKSPDNPRYVLQEQQGTHERPIPLPRQFIVSESELDTVLFNEPPAKHETNKIEYVRRSSSPFPSHDLPQVPRNSLCNDLIENSNLDSVQEEQKSRSVSPTTVIENLPQRVNVVCEKQDSTVVVLAKTVEVLSSSTVLNSLNTVATEAPGSETNLVEFQNDQTSLHSNVGEKSKIELELEEALEENSSTTTSNSSPNKSTLGKNVSTTEIDVNSHVTSGDDLAATGERNETKGTSSPGDIGGKKKEPEAFWVKRVE